VEFEQLFATYRSVRDGRRQPTLGFAVRLRLLQPFGVVVVVVFAGGGGSGGDRLGTVLLAGLSTALPARHPLSVRVLWTAVTARQHHVPQLQPRADPRQASAAGSITVPSFIIDGTSILPQL